MAERARLDVERLAAVPDPVDEGPVKFLPSGSCLLDLVLGGGYPFGRIVNIVGDRSSGKTLLAIEACANFARLYPASSIRYLEVEAAFDEAYARTLGFPAGAQLQDFSTNEESNTVEAWAEDLNNFLDRHKLDTPCLYILDSLDALSDEAELSRDISDSKTYGTEKARKLSQLFRRLTQKLAEKQCLLIVVSQIRDKIGVTFGETKTRSGGRALDFYASQIIWLAEESKEKRTVRGVERVVGVNVKAKTKKNKVGMPYREASLLILFGYGIDDETSMLNWISKSKFEDCLSEPVANVKRRVTAARQARDKETLNDIREILREICQTSWRGIEEDVKVSISKY